MNEVYFYFLVFKIIRYWLAIEKPLKPFG